MLAYALWRAFIRNGGQSHGVSHVDRVLIEGDAALGVEVRGGERSFAEKAVVSSIDLFQTFFELIGEEHLKGEESNDKH